MKHSLRVLLRTTLVLLFLGSIATPARADWFLTPYFGAAFGGGANQFSYNDLDDEFEQRVNFGGSITYRTKGILGFEFDYNVAPNFFQFTGGTTNFDLFDLDSSVQTVMGNIVLALPIGGSRGAGFQPYLTAGLGSIRTRVRSDSDVFDDIVSDDTGYNFGAGAHFFAGSHFGLRADARYIRGLESMDDEDPIVDNPFFDQPFATEVFNFWRGSVGLTFRW
ncbi:MAG TPA: outer membrane beta-barrel protein [Vicinamibacterales bacterium]|nr:outer membrane beta-barrel protein [Vicinamibacterales bacterium]